MKSDSKIDMPKVFITILRMAIGWHFLYEGVSKLLIKDWTSYSYLTNSNGPLSGFYHWMASSESLLKLVDFFNIYGLILIGLALFIGLFIRFAALAGVILLTLYYFAYPPFGDSLFNLSDGHLFIVDKIMVEGITLVVIMFLRDKGFGIDSLTPFFKRNNKKTDKTEEPEFSDSRREVVKNLASLPVLGALGWMSYKSNSKYGVDVMSGATIQLNKSALGELNGVLPKGKVGNHEISRLILGGNLIGGWAHSRDLLYVPSLFKAYNTEKKIYETLMLAEKAGVNTINIGFPTNALMAKYKKMTGSKIKVISQVAPNLEKRDYFAQINAAADYGAEILQIQGNWCDWLVRDKMPEVITAMMDKIRGMGLTVGLAAHTVDSLIYCEEQGIIPDYYMKTMHHDRYWSAHPRENRIAFEVDGAKFLDHNRFHDNCFCPFPDRTIEFVSRVKIPVMGFKVLAAGAIEPKDGFNWAFKNGADFICVGMFDFQIIKDINIANEILANLEGRTRGWYS
jgi:uncharacterized membrane protein YphA (DoxX/SURF4 family)